VSVAPLTQIYVADVEAAEKTRNAVNRNNLPVIPVKREGSKPAELNPRVFQAMNKFASESPASGSVREHSYFNAVRGSVRENMRDCPACVIIMEGKIFKVDERLCAFESVFDG